jgi:hypothetical protein
MSGPFGSSQWMYQSAAGFYPYQIEQSLRFNDDDSAYLSRTPASAGNRKTWTWSAWVKRGNLGGATQLLMGAAITAGSSEEQLNIGFPTTDGLAYRDGVSGDYTVLPSVLRDPSAWYHIIFAYDSANATQADRGIFYVNGVRQTATTNAIPLNRDSFINNTTAQALGRFGAIASNYFDGYMAEVNFIDGLALDPTSFGETKSGIWVPKAYSGSYGTNGFYLSFADSAAIGDDLSGNANDWTANNLVSTDVLLDSPTNNFAVFNAIEPNLMAGGSASLSQGNLQSADAGTSYGLHTRGTFWVSSGKHYCEVLAQSLGGTYSNIGIVKEDKTGVFYQNTGFRNPTAANGGTTSYGASYAAGDIIGIALDLDAGEVTFYKNNVSQGAVTGLSGSYTIGVGDAANASQYVYVANFGQDSSFAGNKTAQGNTDANGRGDFYYAPPAGYLALCTANLPDPAIDPAADDVPADYFNPVLYTGNSSGASVTVGFQPDFVWMKCRSVARNHELLDAVRGGSSTLFSNQTNAEATDQRISSFDADGFTYTTNSNSANTGDTFVAWNWLAGNGTSSNTDGTITSTVSVNQKAGFSVVSFVNASSTNQETVGHGLGSAPKLIISKNRDTSANNWAVFHSSVCDTTSKFLRLNTTDSLVTFSTIWGAALPTSSVFGVTGGGIAAASVNMIAYCFAPVESYSAFGSYTGNGSTDGPFVYCGFRPAWVMWKRTDGANDWVVLDTQRDPHNLSQKSLFPNSASSETANGFYDIDILSNGFKIRSSNAVVNASGGSYIFAAFADSSFKYSNAR